MKHSNSLLLFFMLLLWGNCSAQNPQAFHFGADLSYVNELEDCGVSYYEDQVQKDPYSIFKDHACNLVRLRLWHTPAWYDDLNNGQRYSDLNDVKLSIARAKENKLKVLLDFHFSDNWADPSKQLVPAAWLPVVDDLDVLKDSLYNYVFETLSILHQENLLPDLVQIGNETNKGILLSPADNMGWKLDWERNAALFNEAIKAVRAVEQIAASPIEVVLHLAGPSEVEWLIKDFVANGVTDFDIIGMSYYWAWHKPVSIRETGEVIRRLRDLYPAKEVVILETAYIWTTDSKDAANNIINETHPDYQPISPIKQRDWLIDLTQEVLDADGSGVIYWEPAWVSSSCFTQWGQGSHQEHATFFDFENQLLLPGGIEWMAHDYKRTTPVLEQPVKATTEILYNTSSKNIKIIIGEEDFDSYNYSITDSLGKVVVANQMNQAEMSLAFNNLPFGTYIVSVYKGEAMVKSKLIVYGDEN